MRIQLIVLASWSIFATTGKVLNPENEVYDAEDLSIVRHEIEEELRVKREITCPEIGSSFNDDPPFNVLGVPQCHEDIDPRVFVHHGPKGWTRCQINPFGLPNEETSHCFAQLEDEGVDKVAIIVHGFIHLDIDDWVREMREAIHEREPRTAVMVVEWGKGVWDIFSYGTVAANTR